MFSKYDDDGNPRCVACGVAAEFAVSPPEPFMGSGGAWFCCENHLPPSRGVSIREYLDAVRPLHVTHECPYCSGIDDLIVSPCHAHGAIVDSTDARQEALRTARLRRAWQGR